MGQKFAAIFLTVFLTFLTLSSLPAEEGMYPITEIDKLPLKQLGFAISAEDIFSENHVSLSDAIVKLGGCTGSFISPDGLILTNHHCAYRAIQDASTPEHDFLAEGFVAYERSQEFPAKGYTVRITQQVRDVSSQVLQAVRGVDDPLQREKAIEKKMKELVKQAEAQHPGLRAEVAEMFPGETYYLFLYVYLKDVRLVYAPPSSVGNYGGEVDNWEWPRHTGDFSLMRAYVAPDGSPAEYSKDNVPFHPKKFLQIARQGAEKGDRVFILGYPGRTYRHRTSAFLDFEYTTHMPFVVQWYNRQIDLLHKLGANHPARALKFKSRIKGLANTEKNYRGKLQGIRRLHLIDQKRAQEQTILHYIARDAQRQKRYGRVLPQIDSIFTRYKKTARRDWLLGYLARSVDALGLAWTVVKAAEERQKPDLERETAFMDRNFERTKMYAAMRLKNFDAQADKMLLLDLLHMMKALPDSLQIPEVVRRFALNEDEEKTKQIIDTLYARTRITDKETLMHLLTQTPQELQTSQDPAVQLMLALKPVYAALKERNQRRSGALRRLRAQWLKIKKEFLKKDFIPDANGTYRMTFGFVEGYSPRDAVYDHPITTPRGILEKNTGQAPFNAPDALLTLLRKEQFGPYISRTTGTLPIDILYSTDTTGGNSGSPVLNAKGELVGLNFDRTFEATINDFAWNHAYSRSIGVDIRYLLFLLKDYAKAQKLLKEMGR